MLSDVVERLLNLDTVTVLALVIVFVSVVAAVQWQSASAQLLSAASYLDGYRHGHEDGSAGKISAVSAGVDPRDVPTDFRDGILAHSRLAHESWPDLREVGW